MTLPFWIWQQNNWPHFTWQDDALAASLQACAKAQSRLLGMSSAVDADSQAQNTLDALLQNVITSSAIEGERLNVESVRASLARRLGLEVEGRSTARAEGLAELMLDATQAHAYPLTLERLLHWHQLLFPTTEHWLSGPLRVGELRGSEPMQVVSGRIDRPTVHFEAPAREGLEQQLEQFLEWFERSRTDTSLDPLLRAGIAHFWFITLHPFDDGNGRLTRVITDLALAQADQQAIRFYAMSTSILEDRRGYYDILEHSQKDRLDITAWLQWFLKALLSSLEQALARIDRVLSKARYWHRHRSDSLSSEQIKVLNRLLDGGIRSERGGLAEGISASQYQAVAKVSKATASRHLRDLTEEGCLVRLPGGGRSTRYQINWD